MIRYSLRMAASNLQLRLIEREPEKSVPIRPSVPQLRALQFLRAGARLVIQRVPLQVITLEIGGLGDAWIDIHPSTARIIVSKGWVDLVNFNARKGEYRLSKTGMELTEILCEHKHIFGNQRVKEINGRYLCRDCWGVVTDW